MGAEFDAQVASVAALGEPIRRDLYRYVVSQDAPVSREQAATALGLATHAAKFHLDRLEADGLLEAQYGRPPGRGGPGAGRPAKLYRRSSREVEVTLPERHYDLAGQVLAAAVSGSERTGAPVADCLHEAARSAGLELAEPARRAAGKRPSRAALERALATALVEQGYEPRVEDAVWTLANCPFHKLASSHRDLVCGMNLDLVDGLVEGLGGTGRRARLDPQPGECCVTLERS